MEDIIDIIVTETTNLIEITSQPTDEIIDVNIIDNREDVTLNVTPTVVEININSLTGNFGVNWGDIAGTLSDQTDLQTVLDAKADLVDGKVPSSQLPSYVDDVIEVATYSALPTTGEVGKIYVVLDTNLIYRWSGSAYIEIKDSSAVWGAITGTLSNQTDLQSALNAKANDNAVVHLAGTETITGAKTFSSAVTAPNFVLSGGTGNTGLYYGHTDRVVLANYTAGGIDFEVNGGSIVATLFPSGNYGLGITLDAGYKLDVNGTARISGALSGTSASFSSSITASSIIKSGGTSSQFLKADGSVDSTSYQPLLTNPVTGTGTSGIVAVFNGTSSITDSTIYANSTRVSIGADVTTTNRFTAVSSTTSAYAIVAQASSAAHGIWSNVLGSGEIFRGQTAGGSYFIINNGGNAFLNGNLNVGDFASTSYRLNVVGTANFTGALSGTSATFKGIGIFDNSASGDANSGIRIVAPIGTTHYNWMIGAQQNVNTGFEITPSTTVGGTTFSTPALTILQTGAATFSSSVTATAGTFTGDVLTNGVLSLGGANSILSTDKPHLFRISGGGLGISANNEGAGNQPINFYTSGTLRATITSSGNVGIGTTAPGDSKLMVSGTHPSGNAILRVQAVTDDTASIGLFGTAQTRKAMLYYSASQVVLETASDPLLLNTNGSERMRITSGGNVLIGTSFAPAGNGLGIAIYKNDYPRITFRNSTTGDQASGGFQFYLNGNDFYQESPGNTIFANGGTERMRITSGGYSKFTNTGAYQGGDYHEFRTNTNNRDALFIAHTNTSPFGLEILYSGASPNAASNQFLYFSDTSAARMYVNSNGGIANYQANNVNLSDERTKKEISPLESYWNKFKALEIVKFKYKDQTHDDFNIGVIAQQVESVAPEFVDADGWEKESTYETPLKSIYSTDLYHASIGVLKEAMAKIEALEAEIQTLKNK